MVHDADVEEEYDTPTAYKGFSLMQNSRSMAGKSAGVVEDLQEDADGHVGLVEEDEHEDAHEEDAHEHENDAVEESHEDEAEHHAEEARKAKEEGRHEDADHHDYMAEHHS